MYIFNRNKLNQNMKVCLCESNCSGKLANIISSKGDFRGFFNKIADLKPATLLEKRDSGTGVFS